MRINIRDTVGGLVIVLVSAAFLSLAFDYQIGTARRMGPGYFPLLVSAVGILIGLGIIVAGLRIEAPMPQIAWRPVLFVAAALIAFGLTVQALGLLPATALLVGLSALGNGENRPRAVAGLVVAAMVLAWAIFILGLAVPVPSFAGVLSWM